MPRYSPTAPSGSRASYTLAFRHPVHGKNTRKSLTTSDPHEAGMICRELEQLAADRALWALTPSDSRWHAYHPKTMEVFFDQAHAQNHDQARAAWLAAHQAIQAALPGAALSTTTSLAQIEIMQRQLLDTQTQLKAAQRELIHLKPRATELEEENRRLRAKANLNVRVDVKTAIEKFLEQFTEGHALNTIQQTSTAVRSFSRMFGTMKLGDVLPVHVSDWLSKLKRNAARAEQLKLSADLPLDPKTKRKNKAYLSSFFGWAKRTYQLSSNPMDDSGTVAGVSRSRENIVHFAWPELQACLEALEPHPYWQAWFAVACLAGPRWDTQRNLLLCNVHLKERQFVWYSYKHGGQQYRTPIENRVLLPILKKFLEYRHDERAGRDTPLLSPLEPNARAHGPLPLESELVFPSLAHSGNNPRVKTRPDIWSNSRIWWDYWLKVRKAVNMPRKGLGPREWRHTGGTAMGHSQSKPSSLQIAQWLKTSEVMCRAHYVGFVGSEAWPLEY